MVKISLAFLSAVSAFKIHDFNSSSVVGVDARHSINPQAECPQVDDGTDMTQEMCEGKVTSTGCKFVPKKNYRCEPYNWDYWDCNPEGRLGCKWIPGQNGGPNKCANENRCGVKDYNNVLGGFCQCVSIANLPCNKLSTAEFALRAEQLNVEVPQLNMYCAMFSEIAAAHSKDDNTISFKDLQTYFQKKLDQITERQAGVQHIAKKRMEQFEKMVEQKKLTEKDASEKRQQLEAFNEHEEDHSKALMGQAEQDLHGAQNTFTGIDADKNGQIHLKEFVAAMKNMGGGSGGD